MDRPHGLRTSDERVPAAEKHRIRAQKMSEGSPSRRPLHERSKSQSNTQNAAIRLIPSTPPQLLGLGRDPDEIYGRSALPTHPAHILLSPGKDRDAPSSALGHEFRKPPRLQGEDPSSGPSASTSQPTLQPPKNGTSATGSPIPNTRTLPKKRSRKRLNVHKDNKTFSLQEDDSQSAEDTPKSPILPPSKKSSCDSLASLEPHAEARPNYTDSCLPVTPGPSASGSKQPSLYDPTSNSPWNYELHGGLRKVPKTPDFERHSAAPVDSSPPPLPPLPEVSDIPPATTSNDLSAKPSIRSARSAQTASTTSENSNYIVYGNSSGANSEAAILPESSSDINYQIIGVSSEADTASSVIHRPQTGTSENENYEVYGDSSPVGSSVHLPGPKYSQESLLVPPLRPRAQRSNESFGYYKSRSRESLRTASFTSITSVISQQEASRAVVGSSNSIQLPSIKSPAGSISWAGKLSNHPTWSHMQEHPHQWSSQLSTVVSVSDGGTDRNSRSWSDTSGRLSGQFPSTPSRNSRTSRRVLSISSSMALEEGSESPLSPPEPALARGSRRHLSSGSIPIVADIDEHGDGITDMRDLRARPSRGRLSGFLSSPSLESMRSTSSRPGSSTSTLRNSIPTWARLYYGSGERRYLSAPGSSIDGTDSRANSMRSISGSPNTDHFPLAIYSPRRRPRELQPRTEISSTHGSMEINQAPRQNSGDPFSQRFRTWSLTSVWSPHLRMDRRATRQSLWDPPSINWSTEGSMFGRRNVQIVLFTAGFIIPFAWMIAALLPLPLNPMKEMRERDTEQSRSNLDGSNDYENDFVRQFGPADEIRYESAKWWRNLNRWMSLVGIAIIIAAVVLAVIGTRFWMNS